MSITEAELAAEFERLFVTKPNDYPDSMTALEIARVMKRPERTVRMWLAEKVRTGEVRIVHRYVGARKVRSYLPKDKDTWT